MIERKRGAKASRLRDAGGFIALPWSVVDAKAFRQVSATARALLIELARQLDPGYTNNGRLLLTRKFLAPRGWRSADVISRAKKELLLAGLIHETVRGARPNKASWYAVTWHPLPHHPRYDPEANATFQRGAYAGNEGLSPRRVPRNTRLVRQTE